MGFTRRFAPRQLRLPVRRRGLLARKEVPRPAKERLAVSSSPTASDVSASSARHSLSSRILSARSDSDFRNRTHESPDSSGDTHSTVEHGTASGREHSDGEIDCTLWSARNGRCKRGRNEIDGYVPDQVAENNMLITKGAKKAYPGNTISENIVDDNAHRETPAVSPQRIRSKRRRVGEQRWSAAQRDHCVISISPRYVFMRCNWISRQKLH